ncbi:hypothetical protein BJP41_09560 [Candidatus Williamhamiltonella defendens]|uniref:Uncharacterized protein n=1 Tax=Candidatus Williamhamiltonella defendens TaxID=138072 RepID=A0A2D3SZE2_9ENTR|nr:hypothetical protein [Candidatus Hamiltonella defensa]ASV34004.1 hypothetical protein CJJ18_08490 [Candidatus Hamiltonella defensa]ATW23332.1 hypothetical protein BJP44_10100 [Candidatus Hamiltonella defensa]ATW30531.1 hypothetical protein BJP41_09560 [Candidatus Hamiltonella defensa]ATW32540.1 hypothetical protein BJP42_09880 [Candidatus Hamiltonella defensa]ATW34293.1 hypothetical protein BJP43_08550 [Candidatus Hamiltonella defensa]
MQSVITRENIENSLESLIRRSIKIAMFSQKLKNSEELQPYMLKEPTPFSIINIKNFIQHKYQYND